MKYAWVVVRVLPLATLVIGAGCATSPGSHLKNLGNDFLDITRLNAGVGPVGYGANVKATKFLQLKAENYEGVYKVGWLGRGYGLWKEESKGYALCRKQMPVATAEPQRTVHTTGGRESVVSEKRSGTITFGAEYLLGADSDVFQTRIMSIMKDIDYEEGSSGEACRVLEVFSPSDEFRLAAYLGLVGADIGVRPVELLDFVFNLLTLGHVDIRKDDHADIELPSAVDDGTGL